MVTIELTNVVDDYLTNEDGDLMFQKILDNFERNNKVIVSFRGVPGLNTSFVNSAFVQLLELYDFNYIKNNLDFIDSNKQINELIKNRFSFEAKKVS